MSRFPCLISFPFALAALVAAAAAPSFSEQRTDVLGQVIDPMEDCTIASKGGALSITVPGAYRDLFTSLTINSVDAPRVVQDVDGDFAVQVVARKFPVPQAKTAVSKENPFSFVSSGLVIWQDRKNFIRLDRAANGDSGTVFVLAQCYGNGKQISWDRTAIADEDAHLRIERKKGAFSFAHSRDGKTWTPLVPKGEELRLRPKLQAGVFVVNATTRQITHEFSDLKLTKN